MFEGVWPLVTYCPPVWIMRTAEHQARPETIFFSLCSTKKKKTQKQENTVWHPVRVLLQANRCSHSSLCLWSSYSKPVYVFALTLFYLWQLFAHAFVCVPVRVWDPHTRDAIWKGASVCSAGDEVCAVCCSYLSLRVYWRRQQRPRRCLWGGTSFSFLSKCPPPIVKAPAAQPGSAFKQKKKKKLKRPHHGLFSQAPWRHCSLTRWNQNSSRLEGSPWSARPRMRWFAGSRLLRHLQWMNATLIVFEVRLRGCLE